MHICRAGLLLALSIYASAQSVTLYDISVAPTAGPTFIEQESISLSAAGVNSDGATTYIEVVVQSGLGQVFPTTTSFQAFSSPATFTNTLVADASGFRQEDPFRGSLTIVESCRFGSNGFGTCVQEVPFPAQSSTVTATFSGAVVPFQTLAVAKHNSASRSGAALLSDLKRWGVVSSMIGALCHSYRLHEWDLGPSTVHQLTEKSGFSPHSKNGLKAMAFLVIVICT
ncbi:hypothetical protein C8R44DRAFT_987757 [Mycena epipterygia]|nr:hypothetical protein C8R44DRAFT_987757 [Mycena epipterygia]